jgi:hypothetical protein
MHKKAGLMAFDALLGLNESTFDFEKHADLIECAQFLAVLT